MCNTRGGLGHAVLGIFVRMKIAEHKGRIFLYYYLFWSLLFLSFVHHPEEITKREKEKKRERSAHLESDANSKID